MPAATRSHWQKGNFRKGAGSAGRRRLLGAAVALLVFTSLVAAGCGGFLMEAFNFTGLTDTGGISDSPGNGDGSGESESSENGGLGGSGDQDQFPAPGTAETTDGPDGAVGPDDAGDSFLTRGEFAKMLLEYIGFDPPAAGEMPFTDADEIPGEQRDYVAGAWSIGLVKSLPDGRFGAEEPLRQEDMGLILTRLMGLTEIDGRIYTIYTDDEELSLTDHSVRYAVEKRIMGGLGDDGPDSYPAPDFPFTAEQAEEILSFFDAINFRIYFEP